MPNKISACRRAGKIPMSNLGIKAIGHLLVIFRPRRIGHGLRAWSFELMSIRVLMFGDIVGRIGRRAVTAVLPELKKKYKPDLTIGNVENLAHGVGVTPSTIEEVRQAGIDFFTSGNHIWDKPEVAVMFEDKNLPLLRPANYPSNVPGRGAALVPISGNRQILIANLMGRVFMPQQFDCPFRALDAILEEYEGAPRAATIVDFHAEATSEKVAFGLYADGRVSAVLGTHTHVPTADAEVLPGGTAYVSDIGMVGAKGTVIGVDKKNILKKFLTQMPAAHEIPEHGVCAVNAVCVTIDAATQKAIGIERVYSEAEIV